MVKFPSLALLNITSDLTHSVAADSPHVTRVFDVAIGDDDPDVRNTALEVLEQLLKDKDCASPTLFLRAYALLTGRQPNFEIQWRRNWARLSLMLSRIRTFVDQQCQR